MTNSFGNEYPTPEQLQRIIDWDKDNKNYDELVEYIQSIWSDYGRVEVTNSRDIMGKCWKLVLVTGGWSGNEDIIQALRESKSLFWMLFWEKSERGGLYEFKYKRGL